MFWIKVSNWDAAHPPLPLPKINSDLLSVDCCWVRGGVGEQLLRYWLQLDILSPCFLEVSFSHYYSFHKKITFVDKVGDVEEYKEGKVVPVNSSLYELTFRQIIILGFLCLSYISDAEPRTDPKKNR